jgi:phosphoribosylformimino-5-aminoimidazole carboxamide ribotide isomerase
MIVIPAIDLRGGRCVRLLQGDFNQETVFADDPTAMARRWQDAGALWLHVVDLDGARDGGPRQVETIAAIVSAVDMPVQVGGGIRTAADAAAVLSAGVTRVVLGTAAVECPQLVSELIDAHGPERIVVGVDTRAGRVATRGWLTTTDMPAGELIAALAERGTTRIVYTDIERDGTLTEPNFAALEDVARVGLHVVASGGVTRHADLTRLAAIPGVEAAIVGRALYTGDLSLAPDEWQIGATSSAEVG